MEAEWLASEWFDVDIVFCHNEARTNMLKGICQVKT